MHAILDTIRHFLLIWGYWAVALGLLLENMGVPVPGETVLILASVVTYNHGGELRLPWIIVIGTIAATAGDNTGYWIGRKGGRPLLVRWKRFFRIRSDHILAAEKLIERHGAWAIFFARFVTGARVVAGPLAGVLRMEWKRFALFNFLGAVAWVSTIAGIAYAFGSQLDRLLALMSDFNWLVLVIVVVTVLFFWFRSRGARRT
jgi:membrane protein DedA with SNARE-associated domain